MFSLSCSSSSSVLSLLLNIDPVNLFLGSTTIPVIGSVSDTIGAGVPIAPGP